MKKTVLLVAVALFAAGISAQNKLSTGIDNAFGKIEVNGRIEMFITIDASRPVSMEIEMNGNDHNLLKWEVADGTLHIKYPQKSKSLPVIIRLNCHDLGSMELAAASVTVESEWEARIVTLELGGYAKLMGELHCMDLKLTAQTNATVVLKGSSKYADYDVRSRSVLDTRNFTAESACVRATGFSESFVYGKERTVIESWDGASVFFRGAPEIMRQRSGRGGTINSIGN